MWISDQTIKLQVQTLVTPWPLTWITTPCWCHVWDLFTSSSSKHSTTQPSIKGHCSKFKWDHHTLNGCETYIIYCTPRCQFFVFYSTICIDVDAMASGIWWSCTAQKDLLVQSCNSYWNIHPFGDDLRIPEIWEFPPLTSSQGSGVLPSHPQTPQSPFRCA